MSAAGMVALFVGLTLALGVGWALVVAGLLLLATGAWVLDLDSEENRS